MSRVNARSGSDIGFRLGTGAFAALVLALVGSIGVVGLYVVRIYKDVRGRPSYIVQSAIGFSPADPGEQGAAAIREKRAEA